MSNIPYHALNLVQLEGVEEWYIAIPQPPAERDEATGQDVPRLLIDVNKDLTFAVDDSMVTVVDLKPVPLFNRRIPITLDFIPTMLEASPFDVLLLVLRPTIANAVAYEQKNELTAQKRLLLLTLLDLVQTLGRGLQQALVAALDQEESLYIEHDFLAHQVQARLRQAGVKADVWEDSEEDTGEATTWTGPKH
jgi:hypothetical protein